MNLTGKKCILPSNYHHIVLQKDKSALNYFSNRQKYPNKFSKKKLKTHSMCHRSFNLQHFRGSLFKYKGENAFYPLRLEVSTHLRFSVQCSKIDDRPPQCIFLSKQFHPSIFCVTLDRNQVTRLSVRPEYNATRSSSTSAVPTAKLSTSTQLWW